MDRFTVAVVRRAFRLTQDWLRNSPSGANRAHLGNHSFALIGATFLALCLTTTAAATNIVLINVDELGPGEVGPDRHSEIPTPNIDALAASGMVLRQGYATANVCAPSRAGLMSGRYQQKFGFYQNPGDTPPEEFGLPSNVPIMPEVLRAAGYSTGMVGKWHLGVREDQHPLRRGFDEFLGMLNASHSYFGETPRNPIMRGFTPEPQSGYLTDAFAAEAISFIDRHAAEPFFLYAAFNAIHDPLEAKPDVLARLAFIQPERRRVMAGALVSVDDAVGRIVGELRNRHLLSKTIIVFMGDNGCPELCSNGGLRGRKGTFWEGGTRIAFIVSWPGVVPANSATSMPVMAFDLLPTFLAANNDPIPAGLDGVNILPLLTGRAQVPHEALFWQSRPGHGSVRRGNWKLIEMRPQGRLPAIARALGFPVGYFFKSTYQLYNLDIDPGETTDVAAANPELLGDLQALRAGWEATLSRPMWLVE